jgi:hypothetical protein
MRLPCIRDKGGTVKGCDFTYSHLLPEKPLLFLFEETLTKFCRRCGAIYTAHSRAQKRCEACRVIAANEKQQRSNARLKVRRAASRACRAAG